MQYLRKETFINKFTLKKNKVKRQWTEKKKILRDVHKCVKKVVLHACIGSFCTKEHLQIIFPIITSGSFLNDHVCLTSYMNNPIENFNSLHDKLIK